MAFIIIFIILDLISLAVVISSCIEGDLFYTIFFMLYAGIFTWTIVKMIDKRLKKVSIDNIKPGDKLKSRNWKEGKYIEITSKTLIEERKYTAVISNLESYRETEVMFFNVRDEYGKTVKVITISKIDILIAI